MSLFRRATQASQFPITFLLIVNLFVGLFTFRDYGLSWDEPLFYAYADALPYAYTPANWFASDFDLSRAYGPSGDDHKTRGPAYLLLALGPEKLLETLGFDQASAWHLVNFLFFQLGIFFVYRLAARWMSRRAAFGAAALFSFQPLLWGHAFINPKDIPFLVFCTGALLFGFEMADALNDKTKNIRQRIYRLLLAAFFLGFATSIRVLAPLAGILVLIYAVIQHAGLNRQSALNHLAPGTRKPALFLLAYTSLSILFMLASWPYLWEAPLARFIEVFQFMSANPTGLQVLFNGDLYRAYELPRRYLPALLAITLTEPVWPLFVIGLLAAWRTTKKQAEWRPLALTFLWFAIPFAYVLLRRPPMYDGFRHFLFILPPVFIAAGLAFDFLFERLQRPALQALFLITALLPGLIGIVHLHPYEYTYYNQLAGGTGGAFREFETDYWLTCYKEAVEQFNEQASEPVNLFVRREPYIAETYAASRITIRDYRAEFGQIQSGDFVLVNTRSNEDQRTFKDAPIALEIGRGGAVFCFVKQIP